MLDRMPLGNAEKHQMTTHDLLSSTLLSHDIVYMVMMHVGGSKRRHTLVDLANCSLVCKQWHQVLSDASFYLKLTRSLLESTGYVPDKRSISDALTIAYKDSSIAESERIGAAREVYREVLKMVDRPGLYGAELCALLWEVPGCDNSHECTAAQRGAAVEAPAPVPLDEELSENSDGSASALSPDEAIRASLRHGMRGAGVRGLGMAPIAHGKNRDEMLAEAARKLGRSQSPPMAASSWNSGGLLMLLPHGSALLLSHTREDGKNFWSGTPSLTQSLAMYEAGGTLRAKEGVKRRWARLPLRTTRWGVPRGARGDDLVTVFKAYPPSVVASATEFRLVRRAIPRRCGRCGRLRHCDVAPSASGDVPSGPGTGAGQGGERQANPQGASIGRGALQECSDARLGRESRVVEDWALEGSDGVVLYARETGGSVEMGKWLRGRGVNLGVDSDAEVVPFATHRGHVSHWALENESSPLDPPGYELESIVEAECDGVPVLQPICRFVGVPAGLEE